MKFHYSPSAIAADNALAASRTWAADCGARDRKYKGLIVTSLKSAVTCTKCLEALAK